MPLHEQKQMKFYKLYSLIAEANDFSDLPEQKPYGFWVAPDGRYFVCPAFLHEEIAETIIVENPSLSEAFKIYAKTHPKGSYAASHGEYLRELNWFKVIIEGRFIHYYGNNMKLATQQTIKDITAFYNLEKY